MLPLRLRLAALVACLLAALPAWAGPERPLRVTFLDVGQGDAALVVSPSGKTVLLDGGPPESGARLAARLSKAVQGPIDLIVLTHPHLDHLGGLDEVLMALGARRFMDPGFDHPSVAYARLLRLVGQKVGTVLTPTPNPDGRPLSVGLGDGVQLTVLWPRRPQEPFLAHTRSDANSNSIVARLTYGTTSVLFMGDGERGTEEKLLALGAPVSSTVLKVSHHGSRYSTTRKFLQKVNPRFAVISSGAGNEYGHPAPETLKRLQRVGAEVFRTDLQGEIQLTSDGREVKVWAERQLTSEVKP